MSMLIKRRVAVLALALASATPVFSQSTVASYPSRPVILVVPFTAGSGSDIIARIITPRLSERWKQAVVVENRPGASGNLGADRVAKAAPDGLTLLMAINTFTMTPSLYKTLPYDPNTDFAPVARLAVANYALVVNSEVPARDVRSLMVLAKSLPAGQLNYASPGNGTPHHLGMELMKSSMGINVVHVPYKGIAGALTDVVGGQVQMMFATVHSVLPQVRSGKLRMLAVTGAQRSALAPDIPTFREQGVSALEGLDAWYGVMAPARTPPDLLARLQRDFVEVLESDDVRKQLLGQGLFVQTSSSADLRDQIRADLVRWGKVVADARIQPE
jgi:tripartite-type tricarboxylate transporter receptor subunit TctC